MMDVSSGAPPSPSPFPSAGSDRLRNQEMRMWTFFLLPFSLTLVGLGSWLAYTRHTICFDKVLPVSLMLIGAFLFLNTLLGFYAVRRDLKFDLTVAHLFLTGTLLVALLGVTMFGFVAVYSHGGDGMAQNDYTLKGQFGGGRADLLASYSSWLLQHFSSLEKWNNVRTCIMGPDYCSLRPKGDLKTGCCSKPLCDFNLQCPQACYNCDSCQVAILRGVESAWTIATVIMLGDWVALTAIYLNQCRVFANPGVYLKIARSLSTRSWR